MESHTTEDTGKRERHLRVLGWIFVALGILQLFMGEWLYGAFLLAYALFVLATKRVERLPKVVRYLIVAAFAAFAVFILFRIISGFLPAR
jgi:hypothetical protein